MSEKNCSQMEKKFFNMRVNTYGLRAKGVLVIMAGSYLQHKHTNTLLPLEITLVVICLSQLGCNIKILPIAVVLLSLL